MLCLQINAPRYLVLKFVVVFLQDLNSLGVGYMAEFRTCHMFQTLDKTFVHEGIEKVHLFRRMLQNIVDDIFQHGLCQDHIVLQVCKRDFRLDHPELSRMTGSIGILCTEGRSEGIDIAEGLCEGLAV